ncbi:type VI secretion system baseplate subunit TssF, partial [Burkholderia pseudomallei]
MRASCRAGLKKRGDTVDPQLLDYYNQDLIYMRELGAEFARAHPKN